MRKIDASYRLMKIFKMLHEKPRSMDEICDELYSEDICINRETVSKYFKTLRKFGCKITKSHKKITLASVPFSLDLSNEDLRHLALFENLAINLYGENIKYSIKSALSKILSLTDCTGNDVYGKYLNQALGVNNISTLFKDKISKLLKFGYENSKIKILYEDKKINISHISFKYYDNAVFVHVFNEDTKNFELLLLENIKEIYPTPETSSASNFAPYTVFSLNGRLKNSYSLHEGERVIKVEQDAIIISNNYEDKNQLFKRLVRYGTLCKIISPKNDIEKFKIMLDNMLLNFQRKDFS